MSKRFIKAQPLRTRNQRVSFFLILLLATSVQLIARERVQRRFDSATGLQISTIFSLVQDAEGFIWIGTAGGLVRYDGNQIRRWAVDIINRDVMTLAISPAGEVVLAEGDGTLYRVASDKVVPILGADGNPITNLLSAEFDDSGNLWTISRSGFQVRATSGTWSTIDTAQFPGQRVRRLRPASQGYIFVITNLGVWKIRAGEKPQRIADIERCVDVVEHPNGSLFVAAWRIDGEIIEVLPSGRTILRASIRGRPIDLTVRRNVVWVSFDLYLLALRPNEPPEWIGAEDGLPGGGPLLVDHEGSLWLGTFSALIQYPEPETTIWNSKDGLPSAHTRAIAKTSEGIWVFTWQGLGRLTRESNAWRANNERMFSSRPCVDKSETLIFNSYPTGLIERRDGKFQHLTDLPGGPGLAGCSRAHDGTLLLATSVGIFRRLNDDQPFRLISSPQFDGEPAGIAGVLEDNQRRVWAATDDGRVCKIDGADLLADLTTKWACQPIDQSPNVFDLEQLSSSSIWMSNTRSGVWRYRDDHWEQIPGSKKLPSQVVFSLAPARNGGVWLVGQGVTMRVIERLDLPDGWEVLEIISAWEGLPGSETTALIEEAEGDIWLSTPSGVVLVPAEARQAEAVPPRVRTIEVVINGQTIDASQHALSLSHNSNVELRFSALSYRDRSRLRYQYRLRPNEPWIDSRDTAPVLRFAGLRPGNYQIEVRASLDGTNWTATPAQLQFEVLNPWYLRPLTLILFVILLAAVLYLIYRARIGMLTRLEKQRARIAMDLHDQMGSGLGSIGILSGLAAEDNLSGVSRKDLAEKIAATAGELGNSLSEIVWALKPEAATLDALAYHVAERGGRLFPSDVPAFITEFPAQWPKVELSLSVRRNLLLIAAEALHNAARHSEAKLVKFGIRQERGKRWRLWVADDGRGFSNGASSSSGSGIGLNSMRRRADEITANISWTTNNGKGTIVTVVFDPRAEDLRIE